MEDSDLLESQIINFEQFINQLGLIFEFYIALYYHFESDDMTLII